MKVLTLNQLLSNWHVFNEPIEREEIDLLDWDELLLKLNISCPQTEEVQDKSIIVSDIDMNTYHNPAVVFSFDTN